MDITIEKEQILELISPFSDEAIRERAEARRVDAFGTIAKFMQRPKPEEIEKPCKKCAGLGYFGRTGLFELLEVDDAVRQLLLKDPKLDLIRKAAKVAGMRSFQEEGVLLIAKGVTSLAELQRVLKQ